MLKSKKKKKDKKKAFTFVTDESVENQQENYKFNKRCEKGKDLARGMARMNRNFVELFIKTENTRVAGLAGTMKFNFKHSEFETTTSS